VVDTVPQNATVLVVNSSIVDNAATVGGLKIW